MTVLSLLIGIGSMRTFKYECIPVTSAVHIVHALLPICVSAAHVHTYVCVLLAEGSQRDIYISVSHQLKRAWCVSPCIHATRHLRESSCTCVRTYVCILHGKREGNIPASILDLSSSFSKVSLPTLRGTRSSLPRPRGVLSTSCSDGKGMKPQHVHTSSTCAARVRAL